MLDASVGMSLLAKVVISLIIAMLLRASRAGSLPQREESSIN